MTTNNFTEAARAEAPPACEHYWISHSQDSALIPWVIRCGSCGAFNTAEMDRAARAHLAAPNPLTPDAIEAALNDYMPKAAIDRLSDKQVMNLAEDMHAALTEPPARPEGSYELETVIGLNAGKWTNGAEDVRALADLLASNGVRVTGGE